MARATQTEFTCSICNWPVDLNTCTTDDVGKPAHEECYMLRELLKTATEPHADAKSYLKTGNGRSSNALR